MRRDRHNLLDLLQISICIGMKVLVSSTAYIRGLRLSSWKVNVNIWTGELHPDVPHLAFSS